MSLVDTLRSKGSDIAGRAVARLFEDEKRAQKIGDLFTAISRGRQALDSAQESALKGLGVASSGELRAAGKRLARLRRSARQLDEKLGTLARKIPDGTAK